MHSLPMNNARGNYLAACASCLYPSIMYGGPSQSTCFKLLSIMVCSSYHP